MGRRQAVAYARLARIPSTLATTRPTKFLLGGVVTPSAGTLDIRVPIAPTMYATLRVDVVDVDIPFLMGLDALDALALYVNTVENKLKCDRRGIATPLTRKYGHVYLEWSDGTHYSTGELERLHRHFNHPQPGRLSALLRRAADPKAVPGTHEQLERLTEACDVCQRLAKAPGRFRVALPPEDIVFNRTILIDLMYLDGRSLMHIVDKDTLYSAASFCHGEATDDLWRQFLTTWAHPYVGHPQVMHTDQAPQFKSPAWKALVETAGSTLVLSGIESHNALGAGERYHSFLRLVYRKVRLAHPGLSPELSLSMATAAMNQTAGPRGLIPTLLVFGVIPRMPVAPLPLPAQRDRIQAMVTARKEMAMLVARARVRTGLAASVPAAADREIIPGTAVMVYRERPVDQWEGPYVAVAVKDKTVWLAIDGQLKVFNVDKVKPHVAAGQVGAAPGAGHASEVGAPPSPAADNADAGALPAAGTPSAPAVRDGTATEALPANRPSAGPGMPANNQDSRVDAVPAGPADLSGLPTDNAGNPDYGSLLDTVLAGEHFLSSLYAATTAFVSEQPRVMTTDPRGSRAARRRRSSAVAGAAAAASASTTRPMPVKTFITDVVPPGDPRIATARFKAAAVKEADGLQERGTFKKVRECEVPKGANIVGGRMVYTVKNVGTADEAPKARYVAQGNRDQAKLFVVHNLATLRQRSTRILVSTAANLGLRLFADDITQAYLQSEDRYTRQIYLRPRPADRHLFDLDEGEILLLLRPLYGMCDAGDYWHATLTGHVEKDLLMAPLTSDPAMYVKRGADGDILGLLAAYVDDILMAGNESFQKETELTLRRFEAKKRLYDKAEFVGVTVSTAAGPPRVFSLSQPVYADRLAPLPREATFKAFSSTRASAAWLAHTRPDLGCAVNKIAQVSEREFDSNSTRSLNALIKKAKAGRDLALYYPMLDRQTLRLRVYADASFAGNADLSSQLGFVILLCDASGRSHVLSYGSRKCKRVVRSAMAAEVYALAAAMDEAFTLRYDLEMLYRRRVPLNLFTDSKQAFDVITRATHPTEKRLMIDIAALRESYNRHEISYLGLVTTENNMADAMTKLKCGSALDCLLRTGVDATPVAQWVVRPSVDPPCPTTGGRGV